MQGAIRGGSCGGLATEILLSPARAQSPSLTDIVTAAYDPTTSSSPSLPPPESGHLAVQSRFECCVLKTYGTAAPACPITLGTKTRPRKQKGRETSPRRVWEETAVVRPRRPANGSGARYNFRLCRSCPYRIPRTSGQARQLGLVRARCIARTTAGTTSTVMAMIISILWTSSPATVRLPGRSCPSAVRSAISRAKSTGWTAARSSQWPSRDSGKRSQPTARPMS